MTEPVTSRPARFLYTCVATWPRRLALFGASGWALAWLILYVLNGAEWVSFVSCAALGVALGFAIPVPDEIRARLDSNDTEVGS
jgi:hypothetical protein